MRYLPVGYLPKIKWNSRYIRATDSNMEDTLNVQRKNDKVQLNKETYAKKYRGKLINTMYIPSHADYESNLEQVSVNAYTLAHSLRWLIEKVSR